MLPEAVAGHSYGELTALCAAGCYDEAGLHELSRLRGRLMAEGNGDKGGMLAVRAPLATVKSIIAEAKLNLVIANRNAPQQAILSGSSAEIKRAAAILANQNIDAKQLQVAAAFHSGLVADAALPFQAGLEKIEFKPACIPVYANSTAAEYPADEAKAKTLLANQLARSVEFVAEIEAMYASGVRTFLEAGPGARLTGLVSAILGKRDHVALALDASSGARSGITDLARTLARLAVLGHDVCLTAWDGDYHPPIATAKKPTMTIPVCGANYIKPKPKRPPIVRTHPAPAQTTPSSAAPFPSSPAPAPDSLAAVSPSRDALAESLRITREGMAVLHKMQEETAHLHRRFLEGQESANRTIQTLLEQQQLLLQGGITGPIHHTMPATPITAPQPAAMSGAGISPITLQADPAITAPPPPVPGNAVTETLLAVVSEKTGYPVEMLEMEMGMDSDLGIDSIKRVEILSALQERLPGSPAIGPEHLGTLRTLGEIAAHLSAGAAPAAITSQAAAMPAITSATVAGTLLAVVSEKTGYPVEMLEMEMGMDSDLGIDSIKRVEILSALQERLPGSPAIGPEHLGTLRTLGEIAAHLSAGAAPAAITSQAAAMPAITSATVAGTLLAVVSEKTGYPVEMLEMEMGMDSDLGIDSIKRVEILSALQERLPGAPAIGPEQLGTLRTLGEIATFLSADAVSPTSAMEQPDLPVEAARKPEPLSGAAPVNRGTIVPVQLDGATDPITLATEGEIWITDDGSSFSAGLRALLASNGRAVRLLTVEDAEEAAPTADISGLIIVAPAAGTSDVFLEQAFLLLKSAASALRRSGATGGALFTTVSRLDGFFGCGVATELRDPLSGGLAGLVKTASREWSEVTCKAIDLGRFSTPSAAARAVAYELLRGGPMEVGLTPLWTHGPGSGSPARAANTQNTPHKGRGSCRGDRRGAGCDHGSGGGFCAGVPPPAGSARQEPSANRRTGLAGPADR